MLSRLFAIVAALVALASPCFAQSNPGWTQGFVPTPTQWNAEWSSKKDYPGQLPPNDGDASIITTGGTAVVAIQCPCNGGYITNPYNAAAQGIGTAENLYCDPINVPGSTDAQGNGTTTILQPGQTYYVPLYPAGTSIRCNAFTSGHKYTVVAW